jgi:NitT/TauT family transport system substrate-binding protein
VNLNLCKLTQLFLVLFVLAQACAPAPVETPEPMTLRVVLLPYLTFAPLFIAEEEGLFAEQGLQIEFVKLARSAQAVPALVQGELDVVGGTASLSLLNAIARGAEIRFVAGKAFVAPTGCAYNGLMARRTLIEGGALASPADLEGRRLAANPASSSGYFAERLLGTADLTLEDVQTVDLSSPVKLEAFREGTVDVAYASEPWVTRISEAGDAVLWMPGTQVVPGFQLGFILYGPALLEDNPDAGRRFMIAYLKALRQYNQGKTERNLAILAEYTELDVELLKRACWPSFRADGQIDVQSVLDFQAWAVEKGYVEKPLTEEEFWDSSYVDYANGVLDASSQ